MTTSRLVRVVAVSLIAGPITGVLAAAVFQFVRFLQGPDAPEFVSSMSLRGMAFGGGHQGGRVSGPELMHRAQDLVLEALRSAGPEGMTNVEVGDATGLNPDIHEGRRGEVTRTVLTYLAEQGLVEKDGQRYRLAE